MKKLFFATALFVCFMQATAFCQTDSTVIRGAVSKLRSLLTDRIVEKAYLQLDRPYACYVAGDTVYFKAYVIKGERHELTNISGMLHVDLINNSNNQIMQSIQLHLNNGTGWGDFSLPDSLHKGSYRVRAYTEWMRNEKDPDFFEQYLSVSSINSSERLAEAVKKTTPPTLQFFPEGGNLVTGIPSKVAFKAIGPDGLGINIKGTILSNNNKEITKIESSHLGMGLFSFIPGEGMKYKAEIIFADGSKSVVNLPEAETKGVILAVNTGDPSKVSIEIRANQAYYKENLNRPLNLLIYSEGAVRTIATKMDSPILGLDLPVKNFGTGIVQVTLLAQTGEPISERMAFIQNADLLNLSLSTNKQVYRRREGIDVNLNATDKEGKPSTGFFSVSVVDESKISVDESAENSILSYLLLTSDLKGYVEKPNYYFANANKESRENLDVLMLTQGYRRFVWKELLKDNINTAFAYKPEQYLDLAGKLTTTSGVPITNANVTLFPLGITETTNAAGRFHFERIGYESNTNLILKTNSSSGKKSAIITLDKPPAEPLVIPANLAYSKYNANADVLSLSQNNQNQGVITANNGLNSVLSDNNGSNGIKRNNNYLSSNLGGPGHADQVISGDELKYSPTLSTGLNGRAIGVNFDRGVPYLKSSLVLGPAGETFESMLLVVDGIIVGINNSVDYLNPASVETVEILKYNSGAIYGLNSSGGVMVITTRQGRSSANVESNEMSPGIFSIHPSGYYRAREFYSPSYDVDKILNNLPDNRTTVFWKPDIITAINGTASFKYFNADGTGTYRVVVEGIDINGNLGRQVLRYKVE